MWNIKLMEQHQKALLDRFSKTTDPVEKQKIVFSLYDLFNALNNSGTIRYTGFYNLLDYLKVPIVLSRDIRYGELSKSYYESYQALNDDGYVSFLKALAENLTGIEMENEETLAAMPMNDTYLIDGAKAFFETIEDEEIRSHALSILNDPKHLNFVRLIRKGSQAYGGLTFHDFIHHNVYCSVQRDDTLFDFVTLTHEVMHGVDFLMNSSVVHSYANGFEELPTYVVDYLTCDFLEEQGFPLEEIEKLRHNEFSFVRDLAFLTLDGLSKERSTSSQNRFPLSVERQALELETCVLAYGLYQQIKENPKEGYDHLKQWIRSNTSRLVRPDFSSLGLSDEKLLTLSTQMGRDNE